MGSLSIYIFLGTIIIHTSVERTFSYHMVQDLQSVKVILAQNYIFPDTDIIMHADEDGSRAGEGNPKD